MNRFTAILLLALAASPAAAQYNEVTVDKLNFRNGGSMTNVPTVSADIAAHDADAGAHTVLEESAEIDADIAAHDALAGAHQYDGSGNAGNLSTDVDTLQELNDAVDVLVAGDNLGDHLATQPIQTGNNPIQYTTNFEIEFIDGGSTNIVVSFDDSQVTTYDNFSWSFGAQGFGSPFGTFTDYIQLSTVNLDLSGDRIFHDTDQDGVKDAGEEFIDQAGGGGGGPNPELMINGNLRWNPATATDYIEPEWFPDDTTPGVNRFFEGALSRQSTVETMAWSAAYQPSGTVWADDAMVFVVYNSDIASGSGITITVGAMGIANEVTIPVVFTASGAWEEVIIPKSSDAVLFQDPPLNTMLLKGEWSSEDDVKVGFDIFHTRAQFE